MQTAQGLGTRWSSFRSLLPSHIPTMKQKQQSISNFFASKGTVAGPSSTAAAAAAKADDSGNLAKPHKAVQEVRGWCTHIRAGDTSGWEAGSSLLSRSACCVASLYLGGRLLLAHTHPSR